MRRALMITGRVLGAVVLVGGGSPLLLGCDTPARPAAPGPTPTTAPPTIAGDEQPTNVIVGMVTADSIGPCYLVETDEGRRYALYGSGGRLARGQRVLVQIAPLTASVECGPGDRALIMKLTS